MDTIDPSVTGHRAPDDRPLLPARHVCAHFKITPRTLHRWLANEELGFPRPIIINSRQYFKPRELEDFEYLRRFRAGSKAA
jgi:hypothetical protein